MTMRVKLLMVCTALLCTAVSIHGQFLELGGFMGASGYAGDATLGRVDVLELHPAYGVFLRLNPCKALSIRMSVLRGAASADEANTFGYAYFSDQRISFRNQFFEAALTPELNFLNFGKKRRLSCAYLFSGMAMVRYEQVLRVNEQTVEQPIQLDRGGDALQVVPFSGFKQMWALPAGVGFRVFPSPMASIEMRLGLRYPLGDDFDGIVAERQPWGAIDAQLQLAPESAAETLPRYHGRDVYFFGGMTISFALGGKRAL